MPSDMEKHHIVGLDIGTNKVAAIVGEAVSYTHLTLPTKRIV